jgi:hypothetical protein
MALVIQMSMRKVFIPVLVLCIAAIAAMNSCNTNEVAADGTSNA